MKKLTRNTILLISFGIGFSILLLTGLLWDAKLFGDHYIEGVIIYGGFHFIINVILVLISASILVTSLMEFADRGTTFISNFYEKELSINFSFKKIIYWIIALCILYWIASAGIKQGLNMAKVYNMSKVYHNTYIMKTQEKAGFYDKMWKTYYSKDKITGINKETFLQVTKIIMENRADGQQVTWKWVQENQQIPYEEFTKFYADLSNFIESQREDYFAIEKNCQLIAASQNTLLDTFPNNIYNKFLKCKKINFEYGFTSKQTEEVFRSKHESPQ